MGTILNRRCERCQAGGAGGLFGVEIDDKICRCALRLTETLIVEQLQDGPCAFDVAARDREQDTGASTAAATGWIHRCRRQSVVLTEFRQLSNLIEAALEEGDERAIVHRSQC